MTWVTFHHLVGWFKACISDLGHSELFMVGLLSGDDWSVCSQREVNTWVGHQVSLKLCEIDVQGAIKTQGRSDGRHDLTYQSVKQSKSSILYISYNRQSQIKSVGCFLPFLSPKMVLHGVLAKLTILSHLVGRFKF